MQARNAKGNKIFENETLKYVFPCIHNASFSSLGLSTGKCISRAYRWMNKTGGWVWMQTVGTVITRKTQNGGEEQQILCVNYISRYEHGWVAFKDYNSGLGLQ